MLRQRIYPLFDHRRADLFEQCQARPPGGEAGEVERAALVTAGVRLEFELDAIIVERLADAVGPDADRVLFNVNSSEDLARAEAML